MEHGDCVLVWSTKLRREVNRERSRVYILFNVVAFCFRHSQVINYDWGMNSFAK